MRAFLASSAESISLHRPHRIVIVGGGAGGMELATRLGRHYRGQPTQVILVDAALTHVWKPLLHEAAAGSLDTGNNEIDYLAHARNHGFQFHLGTLERLDRTNRQIWLSPICDDENHVIAKQRSLSYDTLVIAIGSLVNDFHTPGVSEHALSLNTIEDARRLHKRLLAICLKLNESQTASANIAIVGGGATGVELAAELKDTLDEYARYTGTDVGGQSGQARLHSRISLVEAADDILGNLPEALRSKVKVALKDMGVQILTHTRVESVSEDGLHVQGGEFVPAQLVIWAAGVKAADILRQLDGLACNKLNQLIVKPSLQTTIDENIFAFGDCAECTPPGQTKPIPPLAQAAHQQAHYLAHVLPLHVSGQKQLPAFVFRNHGSLISLGQEKAVGTWMGRLSGRRFQLEGFVAWLSYRALYRGYLAGLHGWIRMALTTLGNWLTQSTKSRVKLH